MYFTPEKVKNSAQNKYLMLFLFFIFIGQYFSGLYATACCGGNQGWSHLSALGANGTPKFFYKKYQYICSTKFSNFYFIKLHFASFNNIINSFKSNAIVTHFSINFLQTILKQKILIKSHLGQLFTSHFYLSITTHQLLHQLFVKKFVTLIFSSF